MYGNHWNSKKHRTSRGFKGMQRRVQGYDWNSKEFHDILRKSNEIIGRIATRDIKKGDAILLSDLEG